MNLAFLSIIFRLCYVLAEANVIFVDENSIGII